MNSDAKPVSTPTAPAPSALSVQDTIEHAKRAFALKKYEQAIEHYASALEMITKEHGDDAPETADLYFSYGRALLENAIAQNSVLGKEQTDDAVEKESKETGPSGSGTGAFLSFSGDPEDDDDDDEEEENDDAEGEDEEPEDDFGAAWEVLECARAIYEKQAKGDDSTGDEVRLRLADIYMALGDVSLETEKFEQAITDYTAGLKLKSDLLPISSRQIAEAHYKLSIVLDLTSGRLGDAVEHVERALESVEARLAELRNVLSGQSIVQEDTMKANGNPNGKGKERATGSSLLSADSILRLSQSQMESEVKDLQSVREDLALKLEELKTVPNEPQETAPVLAARALDTELRAAVPVPVAGASTTVNDLTSMVKKKKKVSEANGASASASASISSEKRKAEDESSQTPPGKKTKLGDV